MTIVSSGISLYAIARLIQTLHIFDGTFYALGLPPENIFHVALLASAVIVFVYIVLGGLTSAIYNEVLQFFLIVAGFIPLAWLGLQSVGGWWELRNRLPEAYTHAWAGMGQPETNLMGVEWFGLSMGLGFVLSFGYWCTDFLVVQRAMAADSMAAARRTPLIAAVPKMLFPVLVILPGLIAVSLPPPPLMRSVFTGDSTIATAIDPNALRASVPDPSYHGIIPPKIDEQTGEPRLDAQGRPEIDYDLTIPMMLFHYFPPGMLGLGLIALIASFMSGMAGNVTAFNTVWTYDIYQSYIRPTGSDAHYLMVGRLTTVVGIGLSIITAYMATRFNNIMDLLQLVFAFVNAPLFATFLLGMFWKRTTGHGAFAGLIAGTVAAMIHHGLTLPIGAAIGIKGGWLGLVSTYPSEMAQNFWTAIYAWTTCFVVTMLVSMLTRPRAEPELVGLVYSLTPRQSDEGRVWYQRPATLGVVVLTAMVVLNVIFW